MSQLHGFPPVEDDIRSIENGLHPHRANILRLVVKLRGLESNGEADLGAARKLCDDLGWSRCDKPALRRMRTVLE